MTPEFRRYDAAGARQLRAVVEGIFRRSYIEAIESGDPFDRPEEFMRRFDSYTSGSGFDLVIAYLDAEPVGQSWGWPLGPRSAWWNGLTLYDGDPAEFTAESGTRTFALSEIMVCQGWTGRGLARALHDELLSKRREQRATLLVEPENERAYARYRKWGWSRVGTLTPGWPAAPTFDVLIRPLPV
ncbi:GNAT family N-acetyltransferase [Nocardia farcinica]|uniref:Putative acetyltransferase n=1 Tax=Nocardia farcinica (strain IFM 10152) TaxID=247156 RepID=Q5Z012_NOCFA|nr:GNAT family N-acetyltransferase [Nocardia farcinica]BAD56229.1 putative acetyltransferase [Nocardia farcinica IFM 10152]